MRQGSQAAGLRRSGADLDGQVAVFDMRSEEAPCYACLFPEQGENEDMPCSIMGVFAPVTGIIGTIQAAEALKLFAGIGESLNGRLLLVDALTMELAHDPLQQGPRLLRLQRTRRKGRLRRETRPRTEERCLPRKRE